MNEIKPMTVGDARKEIKDLPMANQTNKEQEDIAFKKWLKEVDREICANWIER